MYITDLDWIKPKTERDKAAKIKDLLRELAEDKAAQFNFSFGCYGNPNADVIFMPEIPSLSAKEVISEAYSKQPQELWKTAWKVTIGDYLFRIALHENDFIPEELGPLSDEPWKWNCWITDFVKNAEYTNKWNRMSKAEKSQALEVNRDFLMRELKILNEPPKPIRWIIFVGKKTESYFLKHLRVKLDDGFKFESDWIYHYAWPKSSDDRKEFRRRFKEVSETMKSSTG